jgi:hypothetical protein
MALAAAYPNSIVRAAQEQLHGGFAARHMACGTGIRAGPLIRPGKRAYVLITEQPGIRWHWMSAPFDRAEWIFLRGGPLAIWIGQVGLHSAISAVTIRTFARECGRFPLSQRGAQSHSGNG